MLTKTKKQQNRQPNQISYEVFIRVIENINRELKEIKDTQRIISKEMQLENELERYLKLEYT